MEIFTKIILGIHGLKSVIHDSTNLNLIYQIFIKFDFKVPQQNIHFDKLIDNYLHALITHVDVHKTILKECFVNTETFDNARKKTKKLLSPKYLIDLARQRN